MAPIRQRIESELLALVMAQLDQAESTDQTSAPGERGENANRGRYQRLHFRPHHQKAL
jgi:hypothetical protein